MHSYRRIQRGTPLLMTYGLIAAGIVVFFVLSGASTPLIPSVAVFLLAAAACFFCCLTVSVSPDQITLRFGVSPIRKSFPVRDVSTAGIVRNRWYYFWGVRYTPHGWLYSVSGLDAVEIVLKNGASTELGRMILRNCVPRFKRRSSDDLSDSGRSGAVRPRGGLQPDETVTSPSSLNLGLWRP